MIHCTKHQNVQLFTFFSSVTLLNSLELNQIRNTCDKKLQKLVVLWKILRTFRTVISIQTTQYRRVLKLNVQYNFPTTMQNHQSAAP